MLASRYEQDAIIVFHQGVVTLKTPEGEVWATPSTAGAIENASLKLMQARGEFNEGKRPGVGYSELERMEIGSATAHSSDDAPDADTNSETSHDCQPQARYFS
jgi:hypothetical protein